MKDRTLTDGDEMSFLGYWRTFPFRNMTSGLPVESDILTTKTSVRNRLEYHLQIPPIPHCGFPNGTPSTGNAKKEATDLSPFELRPIPFLLFIAAALSACSHSTEMVFTRQNQAAAALATMAVEAELQNSDEIYVIYSAEADLDEACASLRDVAFHRMRGEPVGIDSELLALLSLSHCQSRTEQIEEFIWLEAPLIARFYFGPVSEP